MSNKPSFFSELKRRNVYKVAVAYAVVSWLVIQIATQVFPFFEVPNWAVRLVVLLLALGFPAALIFSWAFEITSEGIKRESEIMPNESIARHTGRKLVAVTAILAVFAAGLFVFQLVRPKAGDSANAITKSTVGPVPRKSIAILPFTDLSPNHDQESFSDGMAEEILNALAHDAYLNFLWYPNAWAVKARQSAAFQTFAKRIGLVDYWKQNRWPDLCQPTPDKGPDAFTCR